jgi:chromate reductase
MHQQLVLGISGSLRALSLNTAALRAARTVAPPSVSVVIHDKLAQLPFFNPDLEDDLPAVVAEFRDVVRDASGLLISSPEYARGVSGVLKNGLDWLVGAGEVSGTPVALLNTSPRSTHAHASLLEILRTMALPVVNEDDCTLDVLGQHRDERGILADAKCRETIRRSLERLAQSSRPDVR